MSEWASYFGIKRILRKYYEPRNVFVFREKWHERKENRLTIQKHGMKYTFSKEKSKQEGKGCFPCCPSTITGLQRQAQIDVILSSARDVLSKNYRQGYCVNSSGAHGPIKNQMLDEMNQLSLEDLMLQQRLRIAVLIDKMEKVEKYIFARDHETQDPEKFR